MGDDFGFDNYGFGDLAENNQQDEYYYEAHGNENFDDVEGLYGDNSQNDDFQESDRMTQLHQEMEDELRQEDLRAEDIRQEELRFDPSVNFNEVRDYYSQ